MRALEGRHALVTGASVGLGYAIAQAYVEAGAHVLLCARGEPAVREAEQRLRALAAPGQQVLGAVADVSELADCERLRDLALERFGSLEIAVSNAGVYGPKGPLESVDWDEWRRAIEINLLGSAQICRVLLPHLKQRRYGKIVQISGGGATRPLANLSAYAASKAAVVRFAETLAEELRPWHIDVNALAPGALATRMLDEVLAAGPERVGAQFHEAMLRLKQDGGTPLSLGAALAVYLAGPQSDGLTGKLLSAAWDPWESLGQHREELARSDVYTLRRITPADRGLPWGER